MTGIIKTGFFKYGFMGSQSSSILSNLFGSTVLVLWVAAAAIHSAQSGCRADDLKCPERVGYILYRLVEA